MEETMRYRHALISFMMFSALPLQAQAAKFDCEFLKDGTSVKNCSIDSDNAANSCEYDYSAATRGTCLAVPFLDKVVIVACAFHDPAVNPRGFTSVAGDISKPSLKVTPSKGFQALGGAVVQPPAAGFILTGTTYLEKAGGSMHQATCSTP
jgi:hypothetical protein